MSVPCWSYRNWIDAPGAVITASAEVATMPATNVAVRQTYRIWRALPDDAVLSVDYGVARAHDVLFIQFPRFSHIEDIEEDQPIEPTDTVQWKLGTTAGAGDVYDSGAIACNAVNGYGTHCIILPSTLTARYLTLTILAPSRTTAGFLDTARVWTGTLKRASHNFNYGSDYQWDDDSTVTRAARSRAEFVDHGETTRSFVLTLEAVENSERNDIIEFERLTGTRQQFLFLRKSEGDLSREVMLARQAQATGLPQIHRAYSRKQFRLVESL